MTTDIKTQSNWSFFAKVFFILLPVLMWLIAAHFTLELKADVEEHANQITLASGVETVGIFLIRIGSIVILLLSILRLFGSPKASTPKWMVAKRIVAKEENK